MRTIVPAPSVLLITSPSAVRHGDSSCNRESESRPLRFRREEWLARSGTHLRSIPGPLSAIEIVVCESLRAPPDTVTRPPVPAACAAFARRFVNICLSAAALPRPMSGASEMPRWSSERRTTRTRRTGLRSRAEEAREYRAR